MEWMPIESAPRDGTAIWLLVNEHPYIGYGEPADELFNRPERWTAKASFRRRDDGTDEIFATMFKVQPTHWMPLPATSLKEGE